MNSLRFCFAVSLLVVVNATWKECDPKKTIKSVSCNGNDMKTPSSICVLKKGTNASLTVEFEADSDADTIMSVCHGMIGGVPIPFKNIDENGCDGLKPGCPVKAGKAYTFTTNIFVSSHYPSLSLIIKWEEQNKKREQDEWCLMIPAEIK